VRAGVIPALKRSGEPWEALVLRPGRQPHQALAAAIQPMLSAPTTGARPLTDDIVDEQRLAERLRHEPGLLGHALRLRARRDRGRLLLFVDQLEELYTLVADPAERAAFIACLSAVADDTLSPLRVVLSIRADLFDRVGEDPQFFGELAKGLFFLGPPHRDGLRDAITRPAELAGFRVEPAIVEDMLAHLETAPGALPLLQFAAARLWDLRDRARRLLALESYAAMGGVTGALASHADRVIRDIGAPRAPLVRAILLRLVTAERTRAIVPLAELRALSDETGEVQALVERLVDARLLVLQTCAGGAGSAVELVHESLVHGWPALRRWLDEHQDDAALVEQLRNAARQWDLKSRDPGLLWRGDTTAEVRTFQARYEGPLAEVERAFLGAVVHHADAARRRRRVLVGTGIALVMLFLVGAVVLAGLFRQLAQDERQLNRQLTRANQDIQEKLQERDRATTAARRADDKISEQDQVLSQRNRELEQKTSELGVALAQTVRSKQQADAKTAEARAAVVVAEQRADEVRAAVREVEQRAAEAQKAREEAVKAKDEAEQATAEMRRVLDEERARLRRIGPIFDSLPEPGAR
jgi:hypothetical protein